MHHLFFLDSYFHLKKLVVLSIFNVAFFITQKFCTAEKHLQRGAGCGEVIQSCPSICLEGLPNKCQCLACLPHGLLYCEWTGARSTEVHMSPHTYGTGDSISLTVRSRLPACLSQWFAQLPFMSTSACLGSA
ncbi:hypothetical protein [Echinococcus multilocularis]|uniref:Uncharacterized protein n=1 Tax=Echinococcus multilocularis TaxID=6211 RepID=A0A068Y9D9_ECHMU|nr:hypothetical protein [Echinococcus multilocularis]